MAKTATQKQIDFIESLCVDLDFDRAKRNAHINSILNRDDVKYLDDLAIYEASAIIDRFLSWKTEKDCQPGRTMHWELSEEDREKLTMSEKQRKRYLEGSCDDD